MADGTVSAVRGTGRETFSALITPVDEKRFESEIRRTDAAVSEEKRNREKFETRIEKAVNDLRGEMNTRFDKMEKSVDSRFEKMDGEIRNLRGEMNTRFEKTDGEMKRLDDRLWWILGAVILSILMPVAMKYL